MIILFCAITAFIFSCIAAADDDDYNDVSFSFQLVLMLSVFALFFPIANFIDLITKGFEISFLDLITIKHTNGVSMFIDKHVVNLIKSELMNGVLGLRISSCLVGLKGVLTSINYLLTKTRWPGRLFKRPIINIPEIDKINAVVDEKQLDIVEASQYGIYLTAIICLWIFVITKSLTWRSTILNWTLFFIIDDWVIIITYRRMLKGHTYYWHQFRILVFNILLSFGIIWGPWGEFKIWSIHTIAIIVLLSLFLIRYGGHKRIIIKSIINAFKKWQEISQNFS